MTTGGEAGTARGEAARLGTRAGHDGMTSGALGELYLKLYLKLYLH